MFSNNQVNQLFQLIGALKQEPSDALQAFARECSPSAALQSLIREEQERTQALQGLLREVEVLKRRNQKLKLGIHEHKHGESLYLFLVPSINDFGKADFEELLQEEFDEEFEFLRVDGIDEPQVIRPKYTFQHTVDSYRALLEENPGKVILQNEFNVAFMLGGDLVGCTLVNGEIVLDDVYDFDSSAFDDERGGWSGAELETVDFIENPRFYWPKEGTSSQGLAAFIEATKVAATDA